MDTLTETSLQISLYKTQLTALEKLAAAQGVAVEELIRQAVAALLDEESEPTDLGPVESPLEGFIGLGRSGVGDLAENHDKYLMKFEMESNSPLSAALATDLP